jgi:predicted nucleic acid-binding Zn ribbon protein
MSKEELEKFPNHNENNSNKIEPTKNLCVHELRRRLKNKQRKESIIKVIIFFILILLIGAISLFFY